MEVAPGDVPALNGCEVPIDGRLLSDDGSAGEVEPWYCQGKSAAVNSNIVSNLTEFILDKACPPAALP